MYNNDYSVFPSPAKNGDTYQFRSRTYVYDALRDLWVDELIPQPVNMSLCVFDYQNPHKGMNTIIVSRPEDIKLDMMYNRLISFKNNKLQEADFYIDRYNERAQANIEQTESLSDIINYKVAVEAIDNNSNPDTVEWPPVPWQ